MRKLIYYLLTIFCLSVPALLLAQQSEMDNRQQFALAESEYQVGHIDNAIDILQQQINTYNGTLKVSAYRLLALCSLAQDDLTNANKYVDLLLREDPYYSVTINDPERFAELIRNKKEGKTTLVTASQQAETLEEAPVPVTLITEEMIKAIGARTLKDVYNLCTGYDLCRKSQRDKCCHARSLFCRSRKDFNHAEQPTHERKNHE